MESVRTVGKLVVEIVLFRSLILPGKNATVVRRAVCVGIVHGGFRLCL